MKHQLFTTLLVMLMSMTGNKASADFSYIKIEVEDLYYYLDDENGIAQVTSKPSGYYTGDITIPANIEFNSIVYSVTSIDNNTFYKCSDLASIEIPNSVTSIDSYAFSGCSGLTSIEIPSSVTAIGSNAFSGTGISSVIIPKNIIAIEDNPFAECTSLTTIVVENGNTKYDSRNNCNAIIETSSNTLLSGCKNTSIPNSVTSIGDYAFDGCSALYSVSIPDNVMTIGRGAFYGCYNLTSIIIPENVTSIGGYAFCKCSGLTSLSIPKNVTNIEAGAFNLSGNFESITVAPENTKYDSRNGCNAIIETATNSLIRGCKNTIIPDGVTKIKSAAFSSSVDLCSITIPNSVTIIESWAFLDCSSLSSITIGNSVNYIWEWAFQNCSSLTSIKIPSSVTSLGGGVFEGCTGLASITVESGNTEYDSRNNCNAIIITSTNTLSVGCKNTVIPNSVTTIDNIAFYGCIGLTSIEIPNSVTSVGDGAFRDCTSMTFVTVGWQNPISISSSVFSNRTNATLYVPRGCKTAYETADYWKEFKTIVEYDAHATIAMGSSGIATYSNNSDLNFTSVNGLKAYIASGFNPATGNLTMTRVYEVPAGEGLILKGAADSYEVPYEETSAYYANLLVGVPTATTVNPTDGSYTNFILANDEVKGIGFYPLASAGEIGPNKAYLQLPTSILPAASRSLRMVFEDEEEEAMGISSMKAEVESKPVFDLQGRRVMKPTRGLYIKDGKKIMVK